MVIIISFQYSIIFNCFLLCCPQGRHFFCNTECLIGAPESHFSGGRAKTKGIFFGQKKRFHRVVFIELPFRIANVDI